jgi:hypothetical protein
MLSADPNQIEVDGFLMVNQYVFLWYKSKMLMAYWDSLGHPWQTGASTRVLKSDNSLSAFAI